MAGLASVNIKFFADLTGFSTNMQNANRKISKMGKNMQRVGRTLSVGLTAPILAFGGVALKSAADLETMEVSFESMLGSADKAKKLTEDLINFTATTPFQLNGVGAATKQLLGFGVQQKDVLDKLKTLGDISAGANIPLTDMASIFGKVKAKGKAMTEEILQLSDRGVPIIDVLAKQFGVAKSEIFKMASQGKISFESIQQGLKSMTVAGGIFNDQMAKQSNTLYGLYSTIKDNVIIAFAEFGKEISKTFNLKELAKSFIDTLRSLVNVFKALSPETKKFIVILAGVAAAIGPLLLLAGTILPAIASGFTLLMGPLGLVIAALTAVGVIIYKNWEPIKAQLVAIANYFIDLYNESTAFRVAVEYVTLQFKNMWSVVKFVFNAIYTVITGVVKQIINQFAAMGAVFKGAFTLDFDAVKKGLIDFSTATKENLSNVIDAFKGDFNALTTDVAGNVQDALEKVANRKYKTILEVKVTPTGPGASMIQGETVGGGAAARPRATALDTSSFAAGIQPLADGVTQSEADLDAGLTNIQDRFVDFSDNVSNAIQGAAVGFLSGFGEIMAGIVNGTASVGDIGNLFLGSLGNLLVNLGKIAIQVAVGIKAIKKALGSLAWPVALAAGVALVAFGTLIKSRVSDLGGGGNYAGAFANGGMVGGNSPVGDKLFARVNSGEMILNQAQQRNLSAMLTPNDQLLNVVLGGELTADAGKLKVVLDRYDTRKNRTS